jgi:hypothetical protein
MDLVGERRAADDAIRGEFGSVRFGQILGVSASEYRCRNPRC